MNTATALIDAALRGQSADARSRELHIEFPIPGVSRLLRFNLSWNSPYPGVSRLLRFNLS